MVANNEEVPNYKESSETFQLLLKVMTIGKENKFQPIDKKPYILLPKSPHDPELSRIVQNVSYASSNSKVQQKKSVLAAINSVVDTVVNTIANGDNECNTNNESQLSIISMGDSSDSYCNGKHKIMRVTRSGHKSVAINEDASPEEGKASDSQHNSNKQTTKQRYPKRSVAAKKDYCSDEEYHEDDILRKCSDILSLLSDLFSLLYSFTVVECRYIAIKYSRMPLYNDQVFSS